MSDAGADPTPKTVPVLRVAIEGKTYRPKGAEPVEAVRGLHFTIHQGEIVCLIGPSGAGKSTTLRILLGLDGDFTGEVSGAEEAGIVFQEPRLLPWASVVDNVAVGLGGAVGRRQARRLAEAALAEVQLSEKGGEWPSRLSGGQRQRAALARALVSQPAFLALDEPLGALDALTRITMQALIERVWREQGFTALFVTHDVTEAVALADRVIVLDEGRIALDIAVEQARPRQRGAADLAEIEGQLLKGIFSQEP